MGIIKNIRIQTIFIVYLICLFDVIVLKFFGDAGAVINTIQGHYSARQSGVWNISFHPWQELYNTYKFDLSTGDYKGASARVFFANIILLIPLGFLLPFVKQNFSYFHIMGVSLLIITGIEIIQFVTMLGIADVSDIVVNLFGCHIGYVIACIVEKVCRRFGWTISFLSHK